MREWRDQQLEQPRRVRWLHSSCLRLPRSPSSESVCLENTWIIQRANCGSNPAVECYPKLADQLLHVPNPGKTAFLKKKKKKKALDIVHFMLRCNADFCSMESLKVSWLPPNWMLPHHKATPQHYVYCTLIYTPGWREKQQSFLPKERYLVTDQSFTDRLSG